MQMQSPSWTDDIVVEGLMTCAEGWRAGGACRSTLVVPYSFKDVALGQKVAQSADRPTLLFFRHAPLPPDVPR